MIGDWVRQKYGGVLLQVSEIVPPYIRAKGEEGQFEENTIEPIPLTPEILISNGFVLINGKEKMYRWVYDETAWVTVDFKAEEPWAAVVNTCYQSFPYCPYLHQLQHALPSCRILKELKPVPGGSPVASGQSEDEMYQEAFGFDLSVWLEVPSPELIAKLINAGLAVGTTDTEIGIQPTLLAKCGLTENASEYMLNESPHKTPLLQTWTAKQLERMLPPFFLCPPDDSLRLLIYQAENDEKYYVSYENYSTKHDYRDEVLANALAKMTLAILEDPDLRKQYEYYYDKSKM